MRTGTLVQAVELAAAAVLVLREHIRREHPEATEQELDRLVGERMIALHANDFTDGPFRRRHFGGRP